MPITTLIPAYKIKYLVPLLTCIRHQTLKPDRIILSDDTKQEQFIRALRTDPLASIVSDMNIELISGPKQGAYANFCNLFKVYEKKTKAGGAYFHVLLDDDLIYPSFYEEHVNAHQKISCDCMVSQRWVALEDGQPVRDQRVPKEISSRNEKYFQIDRQELFATTVGRTRNWLGEFSNATFRRSMASQLLSSEIGGMYYDGLEDLGAFLKASLVRPIGYINQNLGSFRINPDQNSADTNGRPLKLAYLAYLALSIQAKKMNLIDTVDFYYSIAKAKKIIIEQFADQFDMQLIISFLSRSNLDNEDEISKFILIWNQYRNR